MNLSDQEYIRYSRQVMLEQVGEQGQITLKNSHIIVVGLGGLGCPALQYLAAAGIGELTLIDDDVVDLSNLQRQVLYRSNHIGKAKVEAAEQQLYGLNSQVKINAINKKVEQVNLVKLLEKAGLLLDCTDNANSRYFINQACQQAGVTLVSAAAIGGNGQLAVFNFNQHKSPCYRCLYPDLEQQDTALNCQNTGVFGPVLGVMGSLQAIEAIKLLVQPGQVTANKLMLFDAWQLKFNAIKLSHNSLCPSCATLTG
ncbi:HesA/MoeB/ThiF family protein [Thalassotalea fonticola]|uniref:HesA/MoeB/ThiF family protein n=1 Tax=Thalassotalea fonticola TaxID=3065649 RepID=A0ABZ0GMI7_9GAMM|nr:HesA/MoeB/ThiF family protein [Colwelliaceae bacterium S1-1]